MAGVRDFSAIHFVLFVVSKVLSIKSVDCNIRHVSTGEVFMVPVVAMAFHILSTGSSKLSESHCFVSGMAADRHSIKLYRCVVFDALTMSV